MFGKKQINAVIIGASGYTGAELLRLLHMHPNVKIKSLIAESNAGKDIGEIYPHLKNKGLPQVIKLEDEDFSGVDVAFCCLPHATTQKVIKTLPKDLKVIDLSADFRLADVELYKKWYGDEHHAPELQKEAVYGLCEINRDKVKNARLIACPGCYPTSAILPLTPLLRDGVIEKENIIIDSKSGTSGAGRSAKQASLFCEVNEGVRAYSIGKHRHAPEIEQALSIAAGSHVAVNFTPHLIPMSRGIISTIYAKLKGGKSASDARNSLQKAYADEKFVDVWEDGTHPSTHDVFGTNNSIITVTEGAADGYIIIVSVIDNLIKGASGQAVQNMNIMFGLDENLGLDLFAVVP